MEMSVIFSLFALAGAGITVWVKVNNTITETKTRLSIVEQDLRDHKAQSQGVVDRLREEVRNDVDKLVEKMDKMAETLNLLVGEIKAIRKHENN
jgi:uncharacterized protein YoxC